MRVEGREWEPPRSGLLNSQHSTLNPHEVPSESDLIAAIAAGRPPHPAVRLGIGDDAAVLEFIGPLVACADLVAEGTHFSLDPHAAGFAAPERVGRKALAVNLSDFAAMDAVPRAALVCVTHRRSLGYDFAARVHAGLAACADEFAVAVCGGDTATHDGPLTVAVTLLGTPRRAVEGEPRVVTRSGGRPGDVLLVTGELGGSLASGRHLTFPPRLAEAAALCDAADVHAMLDLSDGLARDLPRLLAASAASGTRGADVNADAVPASAGATPAAAWGDGEDFELLLAVPPADAARLLSDPPAVFGERRCRLTAIGTLSDLPGLRVTDGRGDRWHPPPGYEHAFLPQDFLPQGAGAGRGPDDPGARGR